MTLPGPASAETQHDAEWTKSTVEALMKLHGVAHVVVLTADGMIKGSSVGLPRETAESIAAAVSGLASCARQAAKLLNGGRERPTRQVVAETDDGFVFALPAGAHTYLVLYTSREADMGHVSYEVHRLIKNLGERVLHSPLRDARG